MRSIWGGEGGSTSSLVGYDTGVGYIDFESNDKYFYRKYGSERKFRVRDTRVLLSIIYIIIIIIYQYQYFNNIQYQTHIISCQILLIIKSSDLKPPPPQKKKLKIHHFQSKIGKTHFKNFIRYVNNGTKYTFGLNKFIIL